MKEFYWYIRDNENKPRITLCLLTDGVDVARGIAICSKLDNPNKKIGRAIAQGRARKALAKLPVGFACDDPIFRQPPCCGLDWTFHKTALNPMNLHPREEKFLSGMQKANHG